MKTSRKKIKVTSKAQITLPIDILSQFEVKKGDVLYIDVVDGLCILEKIPPSLECRCRGNDECLVCLGHNLFDPENNSIIKHLQVLKKQHGFTVNCLFEQEVNGINLTFTCKERELTKDEKELFQQWMCFYLTTEM